MKCKICGYFIHCDNPHCRCRMTKALNKAFDLQCINLWQFFYSKTKEIIAIQNVLNKLNKFKKGK